MILKVESNINYLDLSSKYLNDINDVWFYRILIKSHL